MEDKLINAAKLYEVESLLMTEVVKENSVARNLLYQVLFDIENAPAIFISSDFERWLKSSANEAKEEWQHFDDETAFGQYDAYTDVLGYLRNHDVIK